MAWFRKSKKPRTARPKRPPSTVPEGLWVRCDGCREIVYSKELERNLKICPKCGFHFRISARQRIGLLLDEDEPRELFSGLLSADPLRFKDRKRYSDRARDYRDSSGEEEAVVVAEGHIGGVPVVLAVMEYAFMGGSMGSVVGEKIARAGEESLRSKRALVVVCASGGARMQEGVVSLMQMGKVTVVLARLRAEGVPFLSVLTDPTTGGVTASFGMLGDLNIAEPGALIGFAGPRVIEQTIRESLPEGFQRSEFLLEHGFLDRVVPRGELKDVLANALGHLSAHLEASS